MFQLIWSSFTPVRSPKADLLTATDFTAPFQKPVVVASLRQSETRDPDSL